MNDKIVGEWASHLQINPFQHQRRTQGLTSEVYRDGPPFWPIAELYFGRI